MRWEKRGKICSIEDFKLEWMHSHTQCPVAFSLGNGNIRLYFSSRKAGKTLPTYVDLNADDMKIVYVNQNPLLSLGEAGTFDDSGVMPSSIVKYNDTLYMYYIGWNQGVTVSYQNSIGLAISKDGGNTFQKYAKGPVVGRSMSDPIFVASPYVIKNGKKWIMYYLSCTKWIQGQAKMEPVYNIKYAVSGDGIHWETNIDNDCISGENEAIASPCVLKNGEKYQMWYSIRKVLDYRTNRQNSYRIGYAESSDGFKWIRKDDEVGINVSDVGWDSEMMAYADIIELDDRYVMFYNGNGFGASGIGYAVSYKEI